MVYFILKHKKYFIFLDSILKNTTRFFHKNKNSLRCYTLITFSLILMLILKGEALSTGDVLVKREVRVLSRVQLVNYIGAFVLCVPGTWIVLVNVLMDFM